MKKRWLLIFLFMSGFTILAQVPSRFTGSLLWKISGKDLHKPSYILGTHHLIPVTFTDSIPGLLQVMESTEQTVGELLTGEEEEYQAKMLPYMMMPEGESYRSLLSEEDYGKLDEGLNQLLGIGLEQLGAFHPGMLSMMLSVALHGKLQPGFDPERHEAMDSYVQRMARENGKNVEALENVDDQIYVLFQAISLKKQAESLVCEVENTDIMEKSLIELNRHYRKGELNEMYYESFVNPDIPCIPSEECQHVMNRERVEKWMAKLPAIMKGKSTLIAVGALHLPGEEGLLYKLSEMGYNVEPVL